jgi:hypothetical protein
MMVKHKELETDVKRSPSMGLTFVAIVVTVAFFISCFCVLTLFTGLKFHHFVMFKN